jgi:hypothetical protein
MFITRLVLCASCLAALACSASADTLFDATGTFSDGSTLGGTITIDTSTGTITDTELTDSYLGTAFPFIFDDCDPFCSPAPQKTAAVGLIFLVEGAPYEDEMVFILHGLPAALVGYNGGSIYDGDVVYNFGSPSETGAELHQGNLIALPEPGTIALAGIGLAGVMLMRRGPTASRPSPER